ncbi:hypothetical protein [Streptomyces sp. CC77]|uniref:hypothetical protein n=1 Tax=Streptomyces sp. CC77 TaxID=1906739 RepID=UPI0008DCFE40|nr:hypothetical protein [Streptomyces sp. CC77]OII69099.1 hypothetical protein BJP39_18705 [Streptomyces sp. CC77]
MRRLVRGFWGPREESAEALAARWLRTLDGVAALVPEAGRGAAGPWTWRRTRESGSAVLLRADATSLAGALGAVGAADDWSSSTGYGLSLAIGDEEGAPWQVDVRGNAGGTSEFLPQSLVLAVTSPDGAQAPEAALLALVAEAWAPDFGDVTDDDLLDALEDDGGFTVGDPCVGRLGYLSAARAALVPDDLAAARRDLPGGGALLDVAPHAKGTDAVVAAYVRLRDSGALQPLPRPMDRDML